jgi:elongation factor Ts
LIGEELELTVTTIKELRERTGAGIMDCKRALEETAGDLSKAEELLAQQGIASAVKKAARSTEEGIVESYIHSGGRIGVLLEVNCETDFVARTDDFKELAHDIAMQVAAMSPSYVSSDDVPDGEDAESAETVLMQQPFIKDPSRSVQDMVNEGIGKLGENIRVRRFTRFSLGE